MIEFQTDVPMPSPASGPGRPPEYPFRTMPVGASFFVAGMSQKKMSATTYRYYKEYGMKFSTRKVMENGVEGTRVWRME